jgi:aquaporin Z
MGRFSQPMGKSGLGKSGQSGPGGGYTIDATMGRRYGAELLGTALLVFFGAGVATVVFGFRAYGGSVAAGILLTGLVFGLILTGLVAVIGPISGCHVNPAVTLGAYLTKRITLTDAAGYWVAQVVGGILGALLLLWVMHGSPFYSRARNGLGANGYGRLSLLHTSAGGAFLTEVIITAVFVFIVLSATRKAASAPVAGVIIGFALALVNIFGIPIDGASANPARSIGPALVVGGLALSQLWLFIIAPLVGAVVAAGLHLLFHRSDDGVSPAGAGDVPAETTMTMSAADEDETRRKLGVSRTAGAPASAAQAPVVPGRSSQAGSASGTPPAGGATPVSKPPADPTAGNQQR